MLYYWHGILFAALAALFWGIAPVLNKRALAEIGLWKTNAFRGLGAFVLLVVMFIYALFAQPDTAMELLSLDVNFYLILLAVALSNNMVGDVFYLSAIRDIGVSVAAPIASSFPLVVAVISWFWFGEALTFSVLIGTLIVVTGLALINIRPAEARGVAQSRYLRGVIAAILTALCWAIGLTFNKYLALQGVSTEAMVFWRGIFFSVMAITFLPILSRTEKRNGQAPASVKSAMAAVTAGISGLIIGTWFYISSLFIVPMNVATPIASAGPMIAVIFACTFMGESLRPTQWLGIIFVVGGAIFVSA